MTDLLELVQSLWLDAILLKVVLGCCTYVLDDLLKDIALYVDS